MQIFKFLLVVKNPGSAYCIYKFVVLVRKHNEVSISQATFYVTT